MTDVALLLLAVVILVGALGAAYLQRPTDPYPDMTARQRYLDACRDRESRRY